MFKIEKKGAFGKNTIKSIYSMFNEIDFNPPYQRYGYIWQEEKRQLLLDSILNGYDLPKFYFHYITDSKSELNTSGKSYSIIDGKQRLLTIKDFIENKLKLSQNFIYEKNHNYNLSNKTYQEIAVEFPDVKFEFDSFMLDVVYVITDEQERIEELFYRLNEGKPLNNAEKRNRIVGFINNSIKRIITNHIFFTDRFKYTNKRHQYSDTCLKIIVTEFENKLITFSQKYLDEFVTTHREQNEIIASVVETVEQNLSKLTRIFISEDPLLKTRSIIPVYYYFITRFNTSEERTRPFLIRFDEIRKENRKHKDSNPVLNEFDRQSQQGTHREKSMVFRQTILEKFYLMFLENEINWNTEIPLDDLEIEIDF